MSDFQSATVSMDAEEVVEEQTAQIEEQQTTEESPPEPEQTVETSTENEITESLEIQEKAADVLTQAGLDMGALSQEFSDNGNLSDDSFKQLEDAGFPREMVDQYIAGTQALASQAQNYAQKTVFDAAGGQENYAAMTNWATANLSADEIQAFNAAVTSMDAGQASLAVSGLVAKYNTSVGSEGTSVSGSVSSRVVSDVYEDRSAMLADLSSQKYSQSPSFRQEVEAKVARSMQKHGGRLPS